MGRGRALLAMVLAGCAHRAGGSGAAADRAGSDGATAGFGSRAEIEAALRSDDPRALEAVVSRLRQLPPAELRAIAAPGLEACRTDGDRTVCDGQLLGDGDIRRMQDYWPPFAAHAPADADALGAPRCSPDGEHAVCIATGASLDGMQWTFERRDGSWRLVQVLSFPPPP